ncbi:MAG: hypothetical protein C0524_03150 [Rhodobacter sp.]|nr:hypothetical protein [Rhodobacter sp.]
MSATIFEILEKVDHLGWANEKDFVLGDEEEVSSQVVSDQKNCSLYSLDLTKNLAWFVELPDGFDLSPSAFAFLDQHKEARRVLRVPLDELETVAQQCPLPRHVIFVFSIGRCGSTLVSHVLNCCPKVWSLSEPIVFPRLIQQNFDVNQRLEYPREKLVKLIRACSRLLFRPPTASEHEVLAIKFHSQCLFHADLYREALPEASFVFPYRDAVGWTKSWYQMAQKYGFAAQLTGEAKTSVWNAVTAADDLAYLGPYVDLDAAALPLEDGIVIGWARNMEEYGRLLGEGVPFLALRYNELNRDREASLRHLFAHCGLPTEDVEGGLAAFDQDSQAGTMVSHAVEAEGMTEDQVARALSLLAKHPRHGNPDHRLADIYSPGP